MTDTDIVSNMFRHMRVEVLGQQRFTPDLLACLLARLPANVRIRKINITPTHYRQLVGGNMAREVTDIPMQRMPGGDKSKLWLEFV